MSFLLRPWASNDAADLVHCASTTHDLGRQTGGADLGSANRAEAFIESALPFNDSAKNWAIVLNGRALGNVGLSAIERTHGTAWAYYWLAHPARGRGYAAASLAAISAFSFDDGLYRLELGYRLDNPASANVARRAGYLVEGVERERLLYDGRRFDVQTCSRLATDPIPHFSDELTPTLLTSLPSRERSSE